MIVVGLHVTGRYCDVRLRIYNRTELSSGDSSVQDLMDVTIKNRLDGAVVKKR